MSELALFNGAKAVQTVDEDMFHWPIVNQEMEDAVLKVLRDGSMSGTEITREFETKFAAWQQRKFALASPNGTGALQEAMFALGVGPNTELICPSITYWASCMPAIALGARVVFADISPDTLCLDPKSFEEHITPKTKAVVVVHYCSHPADMDPIMAIARKHGIKVIEDVSHAQGGLYKGKMLGTFGDMAACSLMSGKSFACGEIGMLVTDDENLYEKAVTFGHYERIGEVTHIPLPEGVGYLPWGGCKHRVNQMCAAIGLCQLKKYDREIAEIDKAMRYFCDRVVGMPGITNHYPVWENSNKAGWYAAKMFFHSEQLEGLSLSRFIQALNAEGAGCGSGCNAPLHKSTLFSKVDIYGSLGRPTACMFDPSDPEAQFGPLPISDNVNNVVFAIPYFKHFRTDIIDQYIRAFEKVTTNYRELLPGDEKRNVSGKYFVF